MDGVEWSQDPPRALGFIYEGGPIPGTLITLAHVCGGVEWLVSGHPPLDLFTGAKPIFGPSRVPLSMVWIYSREEDRK